MTAFTSPFRC